eukprot:COSAG03_NODE_2872_length_2388_cov_25.361730_2_plen_78_part_00
MGIMNTLGKPHGDRRAPCRCAERLSIELVDALIEADKDFEMLIMPGRGHGFGNERYFTRRRWNCFVTHRMGKTLQLT